MIMPSHAKNVKRYEDSLPLFARYQVETYLAGMFNPTVQLPSGGYIVIGVTEALVAIDVNSGRATKEGSIEQTATKTNLEAAAEVARQLRLRDLAGLIVIDFIDMDERKNNAAVEKMMKDKLKTDRARIQVGRISGFGLMEMSRQRLRPGMIEATTQPCQACHGTGLIRSDDNLALSILRQVEEEGTRRRSREVLVKAPVGIANFLINQKREHIGQIEARYGLSVRVEADPHLVSPDFSLEKFKTATRNVAAAQAAVVSVDTSIMDKIDEADAIAAEAKEAAEQENEATPQSHEEGDGKPKRRRRRRRRRKSGTGEEGAEAHNDAAHQSEASDADQDSADQAAPAADVAASEEAEAAPAKPKRTRSRTRKPKVEAGATEPATTEAALDAPVAEVSLDSTEEATAAPETAEAEAPKPKPRARRSRAKAAPKVAEEKAVAEPTATEEASAEAPVAAPETKAAVVASEAPAVETAPEPTPEPTPEPAPAPAAVEAPKKPKRRGWWSLGG